jgi:DNA polymerase
MLKHLKNVGVTHLPRVEVPKPSRVSARSKAHSSVAESVTEESGSSATVASSENPTPRTQSRATVGKAVTEMRRPPVSMLSAEDLQTTATTPVMLPHVAEIMRATFTHPQEKTDALCALAKTVAACRRCTDLVEKRKQTVFGVGNPSADIMFIGEAPGAEEDATGEPFVGPAGQLLDKIIEASKLKRENLYICNILRCRPPGNRNPLPQEATNCREFLDAQIHIVQPKYIVCWGTVAAQSLLRRKEAVGKLRGQLFDYQGIQVMCTYHPSYLLRNPAAKKQVWDDMKFFMKHLGVELQ